MERKAQVIDNTVTAQDDEKVYLESLLLPAITTLLNTIKKDYRQAVLANRADKFDIEQYRSDFESTLKTHYKRTAKKFGGILRNDIKNIFWDETFNVLVDADITDKILKDVPNRASILMETTAKNINDAVAKVSLNNTAGTEIEQSEQIIKTVNAELDARKTTITATENNYDCETCKNTEADSMLVNASAVAVAFSIRKRWTSVLDGKTRPAHRLANGQTKKLEQSFVVNGERLMYPTDTSLGATLGNIINCRCTVIYVFTKS